MPKISISTDAFTVSAICIGCTLGLIIALGGCETIQKGLSIGTSPETLNLITELVQILSAMETYDNGDPDPLLSESAAVALDTSRAAHASELIECLRDRASPADLRLWNERLATLTE